MPFFLFSLRRRTWSPFSSKNCFVLLAQVSSAAILFAENRYTEQFFFSRKKIFNEKKFFLRFFFPEVGKPSTEISRENKNCGFPQKCGRLEALLFKTEKCFNLYRHTLFTPLYATSGSFGLVTFKEAMLFTCIQVH